VNASELAVIAVTVLGLANVFKDYRVQMRTADRLRIVSPPAAPKTRPETDAAKKDSAAEVAGIARVAEAGREAWDLHKARETGT